MCYIMLVKRTNNERDGKIEEELKSIVLAKSEQNDDGFFIDYAGGALRTMDKKEAQDTIKRMPFDNVFIHLRFATAGRKALNNVHGWESGNFVFAHNGQVYDATEALEQSVIEKEEEALDNYYGVSTKPLKPLAEAEDSDSKLFFDKLVARILERGDSNKQIIKAIKHTVKSHHFWGRAVLYDKAHDKAFLFGDWKAYLVGNKYLVYSSHDIDEEEKWEQVTHGMKFEYDYTPLKNAIKSEFDGIAIITNFNKPNFHFKLLVDGSLDDADSYTPIGYRVPHTEVVENDIEDIKDSLNEGTGNLEDEGEDLLDLIEAIPEYQAMNPFDMDTYTNETGTHDIHNICCDNNTCFIYDTVTYKEFLKQERINNMFDPKEEVLAQAQERNKWINVLA